MALSELPGSLGIGWPSGSTHMLVRLRQILIPVRDALHVQHVLKACFGVLTLASIVGCANPVPGRELPPEAISSPGSLSDGVRVKVLSVIDGTTIQVESDGRVYRVRYLGVRVPEDGVGANGGPSIGPGALEFNRFMVQGGMVELETGLVEADLKGNLLRYVYVDGEMVNKAMITNGHATVADFPSSFEFKREFVLAQENAMANRRGV